MTPNEEWGLTGKVAIVTGGGAVGDGIGNGRAACILLARAGAHVLVVDRDIALAERTVAMIVKEGGSAAAASYDVTRSSECEAMVKDAVTRWGRLDCLDNNVGIGSAGTPETLELAEWNAVFQANLTSLLMSCKACLPRMRESGGGAIINVSSTAGAIGLSGTSGAVAYATTKSGMHGFTLSIAADYAQHGIRANCLVVGTVHTPMVARLGEAGRERRRLSVPLQTEGTGWDVANAAVFLASDEARWITGVMLPSDGGFLAVRAWPR